MNTLHSPDPQPAPPAAAALAGGTRNALLVAALLLLPLLVYFGTARSVVELWERSGTYAHGYTIVPLSLWLVWRQRAALQGLVLRPFWPALLALAACGAAWLLADLIQVTVLRQYALALMLPLTVLAVLGRQVAYALLFPLAFLLFAVPFGEALIPTLIDWTANFTIDALRLTGIPVLRDGNSFSIPSGNWSVVEACSGLRYLVSSLTLGCLFAYLSYRSTLRRALFVLAALVVPIVANGMRAYMIVMIGHLSGMKLAVGIDHLIYGWLFFGLVMLLLFWVGSFWREDHLAPAAATVPAPAPPLARGPLGAAALAVLALLAAWPAYAAWLQRNQGAVPPVVLAPLEAPAADAPFTDWAPTLTPASATLRQEFALTPPVGLAVYYYRDGAAEGKLVSSGNSLAGGPGARLHGTELRQETVAGQPLQVRESRLGQDGRRLLVWQWYWVGGARSGSDLMGKWLQAREKLLTGSGDGAMLMVFSPYDEDPAAARAALHSFLDKQLPALDAMLAGNRRAR